MGCVKQSTKKYASRPGPPYPAQDCPGMTRTGNDGRLYESKQNSAGIYTWRPVSSAPVRKMTNAGSQTNKRRVTFAPSKRNFGTQTNAGSGSASRSGSGSANTNRARLSALTVKALMEMARRLDIRGRSTMRKAELVDAIARAAR